jgi:hypothetical protein
MIFVPIDAPDAAKRIAADAAASLSLDDECGRVIDWVAFVGRNSR